MADTSKLVYKWAKQSLIEQVVVNAVRSNIDRQSGANGPWKPRKPLYQRWWSNGRLNERPSPFNNLPLLKRTKALYRSIRARVRRAGSGWEIVVSGEDYGIYQDKGFSTAGPNFVPLTPKGAKGGGKSGKDFFIAKNGVTVPSRSFIQPTPAAVNRFARLIAQDVAERAVQKLVLDKIKQKGSVTWQRQYK